MAITVHEGETPSEQIVRAAAAEVSVTDARGRTLTLRKPGVLAQFDFVEMLGKTAENQVYVGMTLPLLYLAAIDGERVKRPASKNELRAIIERLDEEGIAAVAEGVQANFGRQAAGDDAVKNG